MLEKKVDLLLHESFTEKPHNFNQASSVNDIIVLNKYRNSFKNIGDRYKMNAFPFKERDVNLPNN